MALWGAKTCPLCGKEYKGIGTVCKDGSYCGECHKKVTILIPDDDAEFMTLDEIREKISQNADILAAQTQKTPPKACPFCGKKLHALNRLELLDGYLCMDCAERAGEDLGVGYEKIARMRLDALTETLQKKSVREERYGGGQTAARLRILYPLLRVLKDVGYDYEYFYFDPLDGMSDESLNAELPKADALRKERFALYGHRVVFEVDDISKKCTLAKGRKTYHDAYEISGRVLLGEVRKGDDLTVVRAGQSFELRVSAVVGWQKHEKKDILCEGEEGVLFVDGSLSCVYPGDVLLGD